MVTKRFRYCVFLVSKLYIFSRHSKTNKNYIILLYYTMKITGEKICWVIVYSCLPIKRNTERVRIFMS